MTAPPVLTWTIAALMLAIGAYCAARPLIARSLGRSAQPAVDVMHTLMGVGMAVMLIPALGPLRSGLWLAGWSAAFALGMAWFGGRMLRERWPELSARLPRISGRPWCATGWRDSARTRHGAVLRAVSAAGEPSRGASGAGRGQRRACPGDASACRPGVHLLSCGAMLYMLAAAPAAAGPAVSMPGRAWAGPAPVAVLLAVALAVSAVAATDRLALLAPGGRFAASSQFAATAPPPGDGPAATAESGPGRRTAAATSARPAALCPRLASCCQIAMAIAMAYLLIQMG